MSTTKVSFWGGVTCLLLAAACAPVQAQGGLRLRQEAAAQQPAWPQWQARIGLTISADAANAGTPWQVSAGQLLGDYYWSGLRLGQSGGIGGFRVTSGLLLGQHSLALGMPALAAAQGTRLTLSRAVRLPAPGVGDGAHETWLAAPYVGIGYSGVSQRGGWGFTADLGVAAGTGGLRTRRDGALGTQGLNDLLQELQLRPVLQVGASYAF